MSHSAATAGTVDRHALCGGQVPDIELLAEVAKLVARQDDDAVTRCDGRAPRVLARPAGVVAHQEQSLAMLELAQPGGAQRILAALGVGGGAVGVGDDGYARGTQRLHHLDRAGHGQRLARAGPLPLLPDGRVESDALPREPAHRSHVPDQGLVGVKHRSKGLVAARLETGRGHGRAGRQDHAVLRARLDPPRAIIGDAGIDRAHRDRGLGRSIEILQRGRRLGGFSRRRDGRRGRCRSHLRRRACASREQQRRRKGEAAHHAVSRGRTVRNSIFLS